MQLEKEKIMKIIAEKVKHKEPTAEVILFGSQARSQEKDNSDWDILILLNKMDVSRQLEREFRNELYDIELEINQPISSLIYSKSFWEDRHKNTPLYQNIQRDGILLA